MSYTQIAEALKREHQMEVHPTTIHSFVKVRSKKRKVFEILCDPVPQEPITAAPPENENPSNPKEDGEERYKSGFFFKPTK